MFFVAPNLLKSNPLLLKCAFAIPIHSSNAFFNTYMSFHIKTLQISFYHSNTHLWTQYTQSSIWSLNAPLALHYTHIMFFSTQMCLCTPYKLKLPSTLSNMPNCSQPTQITFISTQMAFIPSNVWSCTQTTSNHIHLFSNDLSILKYAQLHSTPSNLVRFNSNVLSTLKCAQFALNTLKPKPILEWPQYPQMCTFAIHTSKHTLLHSNDLQYTQNNCTNALNQFKLTLTTSNSPISKTMSLQIPIDAPDVLQRTSNAKHPKGSS